MIIMAAPMMASMIGNTRDTVQHEYDSNRQDSYLIRVANAKEDGPRSHDHHRDEVRGFSRYSKYRCVRRDVERGRSRGVEGDGPAQEVRDRFCGWSGVAGVILEMSFYGDPPLCSRVAEVA